MKAEERRYDRLIGAIRDNPPVLDDPEALTAAILGRIEQLPCRKKKSKALLFTTWASGIAAAFLLGLFAYETFFFSTVDSDGSRTAIYGTMLMSQKGDPEEFSFPSDAGLQEKKELLLSVWQQKREAKQKRYGANTLDRLRSQNSNY